ncbi:MAG: hypothetical protein IH984_06905 [Planctomycetes bacterium]|nr:hypothetical protein [Planctomycetota bacterium]
MIVITNSILNLPLILAIWAIDAYIFVMSLRFFLGQIKSIRTGNFYVNLQQFTDPFPQAVGQWLSQHREIPTPTWIGWLIVLLGLLIARYLLVCVLMSMI